MSRALHVLAVAALLLACGCKTSRAGWGKGAWRELHESGELQVRRAPVRVDATTGELCIAWVGARVPVGVAGEIEACELAVYRDDDGDHRVDPGETLVSRRSAQAGVKVLFDDVRIRPPAADVELVARLEVWWSGRSKVLQFLVRDES